MTGADASTGARPRTVELRVPGDKSISHRALIVATLAPAPVRIHGLPEAADVRATARALAEVGAGVDWLAGTTRAVVTPPAVLRGGAAIDCGNSGTTARLLIGLLAGVGAEATLDGDASLRRRPMDRVVYPLQAMGARIDYLEESDRLPVRIAPRATGHLRVLRYRSRIASAQVKSAVVLAALGAGVEFEMWEPARSRDHTERLLRHLGVPIEFGPDGEGGHLRLPARAREGMTATDLLVPGDPSSAAFVLAAGVLAGRSVTVDDLLLNPTRTAFLEALESFGAEIEIEPAGESAGEPVGRVTAGPGSRPLAGVRLGPGGLPGLGDVTGLIDEIPVLAAVAARAGGITEIRGAGELRVKESDRLALLAGNLRTLGVDVSELPDGLAIRGRPDRAPAGEVATQGDHRIAMAFGVLGAVPGARIRVDDPTCVAISYPGFWDDLARIRDEGNGSG